MRCAESVRYCIPSNDWKEIDQEVNTNTFGITCSDNIAYSAVGNENTADNDYMVPCSSNIAYFGEARPQKEGECEAAVYEEVQATPTSY